MRRVLGWLGFVLGVPVGVGLFLFLLLINAGRFRIKQKRAVLGEGVEYEQRFVTRARCVPSGAITFGSHTFTRYTWEQLRSPGGQRLLDHEMTHRWQYETMGWLRFLTTYGYEIGRWGYASNRLEEEAREHAGQNP